MLNLRAFSLILILVFFSFSVLAQQRIISGTVVSSENGEPLPNVEVQLIGSTNKTATDERGYFELGLENNDESILRFLLDGFHEEVDVSVTQTNLGILELRFGVNNMSEEDLIPTINISDDDLENDGNEDISGLLTASRDVFVSAAAYTFGSYRYRMRGYDSENTTVYLNGTPVNDLENGRVYWSLWGGLNDVTRQREDATGISNIEYGFGGINGATFIDTRASIQRIQKRFSYALSNRGYSHRLMGTYNTGMMANGWAVSVSGSRRWAQEGYIEGTFYDAWSYFLSVDRQLSDKHLLNLTFFGSPSKRGKSGAAIQEMYELAGSNYYNPYWGFQNGEKRNSRVSERHQPVAILRHDWTISDNTSLTSSVFYQTGKNGSTALDWYNARDPRPDYYRKLPSYVSDPIVAQRVKELFENDENIRQLDWDGFYDVNRNSFATIQDANGITGNVVSGNLSNYIVEDRRYDADKINISLVLNHQLNESLKINGGADYQSFKGDNYKVVEDLLGGDFYIDLDKFAQRDLPNNLDAQQQDLNNPNRILSEGDIFGYHYESTINQWDFWAGLSGSSSKLDYFIEGKITGTQFWRTGNFKNGKFPDNSFGDAAKQDFTDYAVKGGVTYKLDGRNYFYASGALMSRAPFFRHSYVSPRTRNETVPNLDSEEILGIEGGYYLRSPYLKGRLSGYYTQFKNQTQLRSFYHDDERSFVNFVMTGIDKEHMGMELALEAKLNASWTVEAAIGIGQYIYTSRPEATISQDNTAEVLRENQTIYAKNFYVPGTPQSAYTMGIEYQSKDRWFASLNFNYFDNLFIDFNPERRTAPAVDGVEANSSLWNEILFQEKTDAQFTMDFFGGKSFRWFDKRWYLTVGVNNVLDKQDFITGGYEQLRFDFETQDVGRFPSKHYYSYGLNYYISMSVSL